jgi:ubiquinone/menaquinone biosynthesis C-methylase UbiE
VDEFHSRGRRATQELAELAAPGAADRVLDVGCGLGGPARYLAERFGCEVTGIDLTHEFCEVANWLSALTGLDRRVRVRQGSGTALPFEDASFDLVWTIQMQMNVADKARLYAEIQRVLRPGGRYVLQELCAGEAGECHLPAPWASHPGISFLVSPQALRAEVEAAGLRGVHWGDTTSEALAWYEEQNAKIAAAPSPLGIHLTMGEQAREKRANVERNYREGRLRQVMGAFVKDG